LGLSCVERTGAAGISHMHSRLVEEWQKFDHNIIDWAVKQLRPRLRLPVCIQQGGGHFEHRL